MDCEARLTHSLAPWRRARWVCVGKRLTLCAFQQCERRLQQVLIEKGADRLNNGAAEGIHTGPCWQPDGERWCVVAAKQFHHALLHGFRQRLDDHGLWDVERAADGISSGADLSLANESGPLHLEKVRYASELRVGCELRENE